MVVLHYTAMASFEEARARLCDPQAEVSAHWLIGADGTLCQLVPEERRAWHAGAGAWGAVRDVNSHSIGIELDNRGDHPFPEPQMRVLEELLAEVVVRWEIPAERVIGHSDMAPGRKADPGPRFDWRRLARRGLAIGTSPDEGIPLDPQRFSGFMQCIGYDGQASDNAVLSSFRMRHRPWGEGPLQAEDMALAAALARRFPVDRGDVAS